MQLDPGYVYSYIQLRRPRRPGKKLMSPCGSQSLSSDGNKIAAEIVRQPRVWRKFIAHIIEFPSVTIHPNCGCTRFPSISAQQSDRPRLIDWRKCHQIVFVTELSSGGLWAHMCIGLKYIFVWPFPLVIMHSVLRSNWSSSSLRNWWFSHSLQPLIWLAPSPNEPLRETGFNTNKTGRSVKSTLIHAQQAWVSFADAIQKKILQNVLNGTLTSY